MKPKVVIIAVVLLFSTGAFASGKTRVKKEISANLELKSNHRVELNLKNAEGKIIVFEAFDQVGEKILTKTMEGRFQVSFHHNISDLDAGLYTYRVKEGENVLYSVKMLKNQDGSAELRCAENQMCTAIAPVAGVENQVEIRLRKSVGSVATIVIMDDSGEIISERKENDGRNLILTYDLASLPKGSYVVKVMDGKILAGFRKIKL
jgi:hypothetical protein